MTVPAIMLAVALSATAPPSSPTVELVRPSQADSAVRQFDDPNVVISRNADHANVPLAVFMTGTGGRPERVRAILDVIASQGYRVIGLTYDDTPAVNQVCVRRRNPACSADLRNVRTFGEGSGPVSNPLNEAIVPRLVALLRYLDREHPDAGWGAYLQSDGEPAWNRILVSGHSQGAGMAAFIAKRYAVYRVVLFSSPWDARGRDHRPAPWLLKPSATPMDRWWAERHAREKTTRLIANAYRALRIPPDQLLVFDRDLPPGASPGGAIDPWRLPSPIKYFLAAHELTNEGYRSIRRGNNTRRHRFFLAVFRLAQPESGQISSSRRPNFGKIARFPVTFKNELTQPALISIGCCGKYSGNYPGRSGA